MSKEKDLEYIRNFNKITISKICEELKVSRSNLFQGRVSEEKAKMVKEEIKKRVASLEE